MGLTLVTGAGGFVGHALCTYLRDRGRPFIGTVRAMQAGLAREMQPAGDLAQADDAALDALVDGVDAVVHLAGRAHVMRETHADAPHAYRLANVEATRRLARAAARTGVGRFILASSVKVNGESTPPGRPFRREAAPHPSDEYARSKLAAEAALVEAIGDARTVPVILRLPLVYGRNAKGNFPRLVEAVVAGRRLPLASVDNRRSLLYLGNLVDALDAVLDAATPPRGVHFVADAETVSTPDFVRAIAVAWKVRPRLVPVPVPLLKLAGMLTGRSAVVSRLTDSLEVDTSSFRAALGWTPRWSLDAALARTASTHRSAPPY